MNEYHDVLMGLRPRAIERIAPQDEGTVRDVFARFERVLGPAGAAKCLHLLAPPVFPLWVRNIATKYGLFLGKKGDNAERYIRFMRITQRQCRALDGRLPAGSNALKALDEYNYCRFTKHWDLTGGAP